MKMKQEHYDYIKSIFERLDKEKTVAIIFEAVQNNPKVKDMQTGKAWALYNGFIPLEFTCKTLYKYLNDTHIDTAIKHICKELFPDIL